MAAQLVEDNGSITGGVDMNNDMLLLAREYQALMAEKISSDHVRFLQGKIQYLQWI